MKPFRNPAVAEDFNAYPPAMRTKILALRTLVFEIAAATEGVGEIEETLKWGEPAYITSESKSGSTIRIGWKKSAPLQYCMYFICTTDLVQTFKTIFPSDFTYEGNRALVFNEHQKVPMDSLAVCVAAALTYQRDKRPRVAARR